MSPRMTVTTGALPPDPRRGRPCLPRTPSTRGRAPGPASGASGAEEDPSRSARSEVPGPGGAAPWWRGSGGGDASPAGVRGQRPRMVARPLPLLLCLLPLAACMVGPDYHRPAAPVSDGFRELPPPPPGWTHAAPADALPKGAWWSLYQDPVLDRLEQLVEPNNQTLAQTLANYRAAIATVQIDRSTLFPQLSLAATASRSSSGGVSTGLSTSTLTSPTLTGGAPATTTSTTTSTGNGLGSTVGSSRGAGFTRYELEGSADWEIDVWGRIRRQVESGVAAAQASAADVANARLSAQGTLATDYFLLRASDALLALLQRTAADYERSLAITRNQYAAGVAAQGDVLTAQVQLESTQASVVNVGVARAQYEHAIAVLTGQPPAALRLEAAPLPLAVPAIPVAVPSVLLQRRPDVASAERTMASENALVGAAIGAFFPTISLSAVLGYAGDPISSLIQAANRLWSLGASASEVLFDGGARTAQVRLARANYDASVALYRQTVLTALQQVEDQLAALRILAQQQAIAERAAADAQRSVQITLNEYRAGTQAYTAVVTAEATALSNQEAVLTLQQERLTASVSLVVALGGGWTTLELPDKDALQRDLPFLP